MRASVTSLVLLVLAAPGLAASADTTPVLAPSAEERDFNIAAQQVSQALREYAQQSGDQVVFYSEVGKGRESTLVQGKFAPRRPCTSCCSIRD